MESSKLESHAAEGDASGVAEGNLDASGIPSASSKSAKKQVRAPSASKKESKKGLSKTTTKVPKSLISQMIQRPDAERTISLESLIRAISAFQHFVKWHSGRLFYSIDPFDINDHNIGFYARFCRIGAIEHSTIQRANIAIHGTIVSIARKRARRMKKDAGGAASSADAVQPMPQLPRFKSDHARYSTIGSKKAFGSKCALALMHRMMDRVRAIVEEKHPLLSDPEKRLLLVQEIVS